MEPFTVVIPARHASTRLPGKPLIDLAGRPMIAHVVTRALESGAERVLVASDDERIEGAAREAGAEAVHTAADHATGTDRLSEAVTRCGIAIDRVVVNLQGDEPLMPPSLLRTVAANLAAHPDAAMATLSANLEAKAASRPDVVKVVCDHQGYALYFSRAAIPWDRDGDVPVGVYRRHLGIYAYRGGFLRAFSDLAPSPLEQAEKLEQLRALWYGYRIHVAPAPESPAHGVDTHEDVRHAAEALAVATNTNAGQPHGHNPTRED